jgi:hypothetical protein
MVNIVKSKQKKRKKKWEKYKKYARIASIIVKNLQKMTLIAFMKKVALFWINIIENKTMLNPKNISIKITWKRIRY